MRVSKLRREEMQARQRLRPLMFSDVEPPARQAPGPGVSFRQEDIDAAKNRYPLRGEDLVGDALPPPPPPPEGDDRGPEDRPS
jgi:hypothetical protein